MTRYPLWFLTLLILALVAIACGQVPTEPPAGGTSTQPAALSGQTGAPEPTAVAKPAQVVWPSEAQPVVDQAIADVADKAQMSKDDVQVLKFEAVDWPDSCLGCAKAGEMCMDVITPGYLIVLRVGENEYTYHTDTRNAVVLCMADEAVKDWGEAQPLVSLVVADLAERLSVAEDQIVVVQVDEQQWSDSSLGCPQPGQMYLQVITPGYLIVLEAGGQRYSYHTDMRATFVLCEK